MAMERQWHYRRRRRGFLLAAALSGSIVTSLCFVLVVLYLLGSHPTHATTMSVTGELAVQDQTNDSSRFTLHPEDHVHRKTGVVRFDWSITQGERSPDGVLKTVYLINGQFPGPVIEARSGDELIINVRNSIADIQHPGISIHWHGLSMHQANEMDGVVGLTQCDIPPGRRFTYRFRIPDDQAGTFWYHAHSGVQRADGLYGGLVVHRPVLTTAETDQTVFSYQKELLLMIGDWYHRQADDVLEWFIDPDHSGLEPAADSILLNGRGRFDCSMAVKAFPVECKDVERPMIRLADDNRIRLRVINVGVSAGFSLSLRGDSMRPITVDGGHVLARETPRTRALGPLYPGERVDLIVDRQVKNLRALESPHAIDTESTLTVELDKENMPLVNFALNHTQSFLMEWSGGSTPRRDTNSADEPVPAVKALNPANLVAEPLLRGSRVSSGPFQQSVFYSTMKIRAVQHNQPVGSINHTSWTSPDPRARPLLSRERDEWDKFMAQPTRAQKFQVPWFRNSGPDEWLELVLNNFDDKGHPFHLHGYDFYVVSRARMASPFRGYNPFEVGDVSDSQLQSFNTKNPLRKDTVYVPAMGYVVLRFPLDNDGLWLLHCHVLWHQAIGMGIALQVGGEASPQVRLNAAQLCRG